MSMRGFLREDFHFYVYGKYHDIATYVDILVGLHRREIWESKYALIITMRDDHEMRMKEEKARKKRAEKEKETFFGFSCECCN